MPLYAPNCRLVEMIQPILFTHAGASRNMPSHRTNCQSILHSPSESAVLIPLLQRYCCYYFLHIPFGGNDPLLLEFQRVKLCVVLRAHFETTVFRALPMYPPSEGKLVPKNE